MNVPAGRPARPVVAYPVTLRVVLVFLAAAATIVLAAISLATHDPRQAFDLIRWAGISAGCGLLFTLLPW